MGATGLPLLDSKRGRILFRGVGTKSRRTGRRCVGKGLHLMLDIVGHFSKDDRGPSSLFRVKYVKLVGTVGGFGPRLRMGFSACTMPVVVKRVQQFVQSGGSVHIDESLHSATCGTVCTGRGCIGMGRGRPAIRRVTRRVKVTGRRVICTLSTVRVPIDLGRPMCGSGKSTVCIVSRVDSGEGGRSE